MLTNSITLDHCSVADRIKAVLDRAQAIGLSERALAGRAGISHNNLSRWKNGYGARQKTFERQMRSIELVLEFEEERRRRAAPTQRLGAAWRLKAPGNSP
jgi:transcriptional regulator with XRE-family HTH domain